MADVAALLTLVKAHGPGLAQAIVNEEAGFTIDFKDKDGNLIDTEAELSVEIGPPKVEPNIGYNDDGTFSCTYTPLAAGSVQVAVKLNEQHIASSPWTVTVAAAAPVTAEPAPAPAAATAPVQAEAEAEAAGAEGEASRAPVPRVEEPPAEQAEAQAQKPPSGPKLVYAASGRGLADAQVGRAASFEITCTEAATGAPAPARGRLALHFDGPRAVTGPGLREGGAAGTYLVEYTPTAAGHHSVALLDPAGAHLPGSPFAVLVAEPEAAPAPAPAPAKAAKKAVAPAVHFSVVGPGAREATAGKTARFEIHGRDAEGNLAPSTAHFEVSFSGPRPVYAPSVGDGGAKGVFVVEYQVVKDGQYQMSVTADGKPVEGSPFAVAVHPPSTEHPKPVPAPASAPAPAAAAPTTAKPDLASAKSAQLRYEVAGVGAREAVAGKTQRFSILARDEHGALAPSTARFEVSFEGPRPVYAPSVKEDPESGPKGGAYLVEYQVVKDGQYQMTVTADGRPLEGSPFAVHVAPADKPAAAPAPRKTTEPERIEAPALKSAGGAGIKLTAVGLGTKEAVAGKTARFEVHAHDEAGLLVPTTRRIEVSFSGPRPVYAPSVVESGTKGIYAVEYLTPVAGTYSMSVTADGQHIEGSPFEVAVQGAPRDEPAAAATKPKDEPPAISVSLKNAGAAPGQAVSFTLHGAGAKEALAGKPARFEVHARDADGLLVPARGKEKIAVAFTGPRPVYAPAVTEDPAMRGVYRVEYSTPAAGTYQMHVTVDGRDIEGSPFPVLVAAAPAAARPAPALAAAAPAAASSAASASAPPVAASSSMPDTATPAAAAAPATNMERFKYEAAGSGLAKGRAGRAVKFTVSAKDKQARPLADTQLEAAVEGPDGQAVTVAWAEQGKGVFQASYIPPAPGHYKLSITAAGGHVSRSPYTVDIRPPSSPARSSVENWYFTLKTRTEAGEDQDEGEDDVQVTVSGPSEAVPKVKDLGNGEYFISLYGLFEPGDYQLAVTLNGAPLAHSPFTLHKP